MKFLLKGKADDGTSVAVSHTGTITDAAKFEYGDPVDNDVVAKDGKFKQEWELTFPKGRILTFPNDQYNTVQILPDLG